MPAHLFRNACIAMLLVGAFLLPACSPKEESSVPADFSFRMDVGSGEKSLAQNFHIKINAAGEGEYELYDTGGVIEYNTDNVVTYDSEQVIRRSNFKLSKKELSRLWDAINKNNFFGLTEEYQMAIGSSYAYVMVQANGREHTVNNIGMEVPEIRALIEAVQGIMPEGVDLEYGDGYVP